MGFSPSSEAKVAKITDSRLVCVKPHFSNARLAELSTGICIIPHNIIACVTDGKRKRFASSNVLAAKDFALSPNTGQSFS
mgnify:CR=1 FL=1